MSYVIEHRSFASTEAGSNRASIDRLARPDGSTRNANAQRSGAGWVSSRDKLHGRVVRRPSVVEMALPVITIRWSTDERGAQTRVASKRVRVLRELRNESEPLRPTRGRVGDAELAVYSKPFCAKIVT